MEPLFVYPEIEAHKPYRQITRDINLKPWGENLVYSPKNIDSRMVFPEIGIGNTLDDVQWLPKNQEERQEAIDKLFITEDGGINLCQGYIRNRGFREGGIRLARHCKDYDGPTALEILAWGVGIFRKTKTELNTCYSIIMEEAPLPKVNSQYLRILRHHLVPTEKRVLNDSGYTGEINNTITQFESTNLILADSYGELEQLQRRSNEKKFMTLYLEQLKRTAKFVKYQHLDFEAPEGMLQMNHEISRAWIEHIKNGIWVTVPETTDELSDRVTFLLKNTIIDSNPREEITDYNRSKYR